MNQNITTATTPSSILTITSVQSKSSTQVITQHPENIPPLPASSISYPPPPQLCFSCCITTMQPYCLPNFIATFLSILPLPNVPVLLLTPSLQTFWILFSPARWDKYFVIPPQPLTLITHSSFSNASKNKKANFPDHSRLITVTSKT